MPVDNYLKLLQRVRIGVTVRDTTEPHVNFPGGVDKIGKTFLTCCHCNTTFPTKKTRECPFCHKEVLTK